MIVAAMVAFVLTRVWLLTSFQPLQNEDVLIYSKYAIDGVDLGHVPYLETDMEYPPLAWWTIATPRWLATEPFYRSYLTINPGILQEFQADYYRRFHRMMAVFDVAAFGLFLLVVARRRPVWLGMSAWAYVLVTALQPHVLYDRLDIGLLFFILAWAATMTMSAGSRWRGVWIVASFIALGGGIAYKLIPIVIAPACLEVEFRRAIHSRRWATLVLGSIALAVTALGPFAYYWNTSGPGVFNLFKYHGTRGIEIESTYASLMMILRPLGLVSVVERGSGAINLVGPLAPFFSTASTWLLIAAVSCSMVMAWRQWRDEAASYRWGLAALLLAVLAAKVLSVQYMLWTLPALVLLGAERLSVVNCHRLVIAAVVMAGLSTALYPYLFFPDSSWGIGALKNPWPLAAGHHLEPHWLPSLVLIARNGLLAVSVAMVVKSLVGKTPLNKNESVDK